MCLIWCLWRTNSESRIVPICRTFGEEPGKKTANFYHRGSAIVIFLGFMRLWDGYVPKGAAADRWRFAAHFRERERDCIN